MCQLTKKLPIQGGGLLDFQDSGPVEDLTRGAETFWGVETPVASELYTYSL